MLAELNIQVRSVPVGYFQSSSACSRPPISDHWFLSVQLPSGKRLKFQNTKVVKEADPFDYLINYQQQLLS